MKIFWSILFFIFVSIEVFAQWEGSLPCECTDYEKTKIMAAPFASSVSSHPSKRLQRIYKDVYGTKERPVNVGNEINVSFTIYTKNIISLKTGARSFRIDLAPCREDGEVFAELSAISVYNSLRILKYTDVRTKSCALRCDSTFLSQLDEFLLPIDYGFLMSAAFLVKTPHVRYNARKTIVYNQENRCATNNYLLSKNNVILQLETYKLDLHKRKNLAEVIFFYENCNSVNPARHKSMVGKRKIKRFIGVFAPEATVGIPIGNNATISIPAAEILVGDYFFSAVLKLRAKQIDKKTYEITFVPSYKKEQLTIKQIQKLYFDKLNMKTGNYHYDSEKQQLLFDVYYEQKK
ncbi:MAG: hypothetical protein IK117_07795 [Bacteroidales bacterium]|nr:hypothetical protein [Bacteroidales bacterium]